MLGFEELQAMAAEAEDTAAQRAQVRTRGLVLHVPYVPPPPCKTCCANVTCWHRVRVVAHIALLPASCTANVAFLSH